MARVDVVVCWPRNCDYPLWRAFLRDNRSRFGEVFVVLTDGDGADYSDFLRGAMDATVMDSPDRGDRDWRDVAVNAALDRSTAERVWFTEQDFTFIGPDSWIENGSPVLGIDAQDGRPFHPACLFVDRDLIERTSRYFGTPPVDHFYTVGTELHRLSATWLPREAWSHLQGISESQMLVAVGQRPKFRPDQFRAWLRASLAADVPLHPDWRAMAIGESTG